MEPATPSILAFDLGGTLSAKLYRYRSIAVEVIVAEGVPLTEEDVTVFREELEDRIRKTRVVTEVVRAPAPADLLARLTVKRLWDEERFVNMSFHTYTFMESSLDLHEVATQRSLGHLAIQSDPGGVWFPAGKSRGVAYDALSNAGRTVAAQLKKHR
jgi:hypothetical protein